MLINECRDAFTTDNAWKAGRDLAFGALNCVGRHTLTGMITASGHQFMDWSPAYRLFSKPRVYVTKIFDVALNNVLNETVDDPDIFSHLDDTLIKKTGLRIPGTAWRRDPLGPAFQTNFIWGQRFQQISLSLPDKPGCSQSRAIPVDFHHCPTAKKPRLKDDPQVWQEYRDQQRKLKLSRQGIERLIELRTKLNNSGASHKQLILSVDGSYTNEEVLKKLPQGITLIGRIRKDTKLYCHPVGQPSLGRKRIYGDRLPTPEEIRQSDQYPWHEVSAWAAGKVHTFNVKIIRNIKWRSAGLKHNLQLVVIRPLGYRLTKSSRMLYREPAYLICTDSELKIEKLLQAYLWRWEIEVNFREEKTVMGCGQAQVRNPESVHKAPAFIAAIYSLLHLAARKSSKDPGQSLLPRPKWYPKKEFQRHSTRDLINNINAQAWTKSIDLNFSGFVNNELVAQSHKNLSNPCTSAMFYMRN